MLTRHQRCVFPLLFFFSNARSVCCCCCCSCVRGPSSVCICVEKKTQHNFAGKRSCTFETITMAPIQAKVCVLLSFPSCFFNLKSNVMAISYNKALSFVFATILWLVRAAQHNPRSPPLKRCLESSFLLSGDNLDASSAELAEFAGIS